MISILNTLPYGACLFILSIEYRMVCEKRYKRTLCANTHLDLRQEKGCLRQKEQKNYCTELQIALPLHRQKVNILFRLVVIDLGF